MGRSDVVAGRPGQADTRPSQYYEFSALHIKKRSLALFFMRLPVFIPFVFMIRPWVELNPQATLTNDGSGRTGTGRRVLFLYGHIDYPADYPDRGAVDRSTPALVWHLVRDHRYSGHDHRGYHDGLHRGRVRPTRRAHLPAGWIPHHSRWLVPLLATANTPAQRKLGKCWKRLQRMTYVIWCFVVLHLLLLDGLTALRDGGRGWRPHLPPALLPGRRGQRPADHPPAAAGAALDYRATGAGPTVAGLAYLRAACRVLCHRAGLHRQRGDLHRDHGHDAASASELTPAGDQQGRPTG